MADEKFIYLMAADALLVLHLLLILFVIFGFLLTLIGWFRRWHWVRNAWFRLAHLAVIGTVVVQTWLGSICPLTVWENRFRLKAGRDPYPDDFVRHWLHELIFYDAGMWVFGLIYTVFGLLVVLTIVLVPPRFRDR